MHPNILKMYLVAGFILALLWILYLSGFLQIGLEKSIVVFFLLSIFTLLMVKSALSKPPGSSFQSGRDRDDGQTDGYDRW
ncbi:MAG: hypothetical protein ACOCTN_03990 [Candidatus Natronoplasma sp.]